MELGQVSKLRELEFFPWVVGFFLEFWLVSLSFNLRIVFFSWFWKKIQHNFWQTLKNFPFLKIFPSKSLQKSSPLSSWTKIRYLLHISGRRSPFFRCSSRRLYFENTYYNCEGILVLHLHLTLVSYPMEILFFRPTNFYVNGYVSLQF